MVFLVVALYASRLLRAGDTFHFQLLRLFDIKPLTDIAPFTLLQILIVREEMGDRSHRICGRSR